MRLGARSLLAVFVVYSAVLALSITQSVMAIQCDGLGIRQLAGSHTYGPGPSATCCVFFHVEAFAHPYTSACDPAQPTAAIVAGTGSGAAFVQFVSDTGNVYPAPGGFIAHEWIIKVCDEPGTSVSFTVTVTNNFGVKTGTYTHFIPYTC